MKRFKVLSVMVLFLVLCLSGFSQEQTKEGETAEDLIIKGIELQYEDKNNEADECFLKAVKIDPSKSVYIEIIGYIKDGKFEGALKRLEERKAQASAEEELKIIQILLADTHFRWAEELEKKYDYVGAISHYEAVYGNDILHRRQRSAKDLKNIGFSYSALGQKQKALEYYEKALAINRELGDRSGEADTLNNIGFLHSNFGQNQIALEYYEKALPICIEAGNRSLEAHTLNNLGLIYSSLGQNQIALEYYEKSLSINRELGERFGEAAIIDNIGKVYNVLGQKQKALEYLKKALLIRRELGDIFGEAMTLNNIGMVYHSLGQTRIALEYYEKSLSLNRKVGDRSGEVAILNNIGTIYLDLGQTHKALEYLEKVLPICRELGDRSVEATTLNNIGIIYKDLGQKQKSLDYYEKALIIHREVEDSYGQAIILTNIGAVYFGLGQKLKALDYYEKALIIHREVGSRSAEALTLGNIGGVYDGLGQKQKALEYYEKALIIHREVGGRSEEALTLDYIGGVYDGLGQKLKALDYYEKALIIHREVGGRAGEALTLDYIGGVYDGLGQKQKALEYYEKALPILREIGDRSGEASDLNNIGVVYYSLSNNQKSLEYYEKALIIQQKIGNRTDEATILNNIGMIYNALCQYKKSLDYYEKALIIQREVGDCSGEAETLNNIGLVYSGLGHNQNGLEIFYGKQAINTLQLLRQNIDNLDSKTKRKYLQSEEDTYRNTASRLIFSGRLGEAQQVLDILKDEEYFSFVLQNRSAYTPQYSPIDYTGFERNWIDLQNTLLEKIASISRPLHELLIKPNRIPNEEKKLESLKIDLEKSQKEYHDFQVQMEKEFEKHEREKYPDIDALAKKTNALIEFLKFVDRENNEKNVALHYLVSKDRLSVIITTPSFQTVKQSPPFDEKEFNKMIFDYRDLIEKIALLSKTTDSTSISVSKIDEFNNRKRDIETKLYNLIFKPVDEDIKEYGAVNLLVSLDGVLRYIPLGSLWDGQHYLVQEYRVVLLTPSSLKHMDEKPASENKILGMGAGKGGNGFKPLPHASQEIRAIVNDREKGCTGLINGNAFIDNDFTRETMFSKLKTFSYPFVHIASHFQFSPGDETKNQLLLGDGTTISLSDIRNQGKLFDKVNLLVLSACQTGMGGNGEEIDGFGEMAQQLGADSVIASLWAVDDESTKELMVKFYSLLKEGKVSSKIEALRLAQLELAGFDDLINESKATAAPAKSSGKKSSYSNPYYWAPFIMMGNGR